MFPLVRYNCMSQSYDENIWEKVFSSLPLDCTVDLKDFYCPHFTLREHLQHPLNQSPGSMAYYLSLLSLAHTGSTACSPPVSFKPVQAESRPTSQHLYIRLCVWQADFCTDFHMGDMHITAGCTTRSIRANIHEYTQAEVDVKHIYRHTIYCHHEQYTEAQ